MRSGPGAKVDSNWLLHSLFPHNSFALPMSFSRLNSPEARTAAVADPQIRARVPKTAPFGARPLRRLEESLLHQQSDLRRRTVAQQHRILADQLGDRVQDAARAQ